MNTSNVVSSINFIKGLNRNSNQNDIDIFLHLKAISLEESWKNDSFYTGATHLLPYTEKKFSALMKDVFQRTTQWFRSMEENLELPNGLTLVRHHSRANIVAYRGFSPDEREYVLEAAAKHPVASFHALLKAAGMKGQKVDETDSKAELMWKKKHDALMEEHVKLKNRFEAVQEQYEALAKENLQLKARTF